MVSLQFFSLFSRTFSSIKRTELVKNKCWAEDVSGRVWKWGAEGWSQVSRIYLLPTSVNWPWHMLILLFIHPFFALIGYTVVSSDGNYNPTNGWIFQGVKNGHLFAWNKEIVRGLVEGKLAQCWCWFPWRQGWGHGYLGALGTKPALPMGLEKAVITPLSILLCQDPTDPMLKSTQILCTPVQF